MNLIIFQTLKIYQNYAKTSDICTIGKICTSCIPILDFLCQPNMRDSRPSSYSRSWGEIEN